jgi:hypothetical protein
LEACDRLPLIFGFALISLAPGLLELGGIFPPQIFIVYVYQFYFGLIDWFKMAPVEDFVAPADRVTVLKRCQS